MRITTSTYVSADPLIGIPYRNYGRIIHTNKIKNKKQLRSLRINLIILKTKKMYKKKFS